jgi:hypothetical protein
MTLTILAAGLPALASAQSFRHGRVRYAEDGVTVQRAAEAAAEEATPNLPFLPGDRVWTDQSGRAEFQFEGGSLLRLDGGSKLDYLNHDDDRRGERIVLRLWSGSLYLHVRDRRGPEFEVETPGGLVATRGRGVYRVDSEGGETRLSVYEGEGILEGAREVRVAAGERVVARRGEIEDGPREFDLTDADRFADWVQERQERTAYAGERPAYLPEEVSTYADDFDAHGSWYYEAEVGHVWRPYVAAGWRPYSDGRWVWTLYGWTWVPRESWGWAAHHYGRWGYSPAIGWYWIPGRQWGPAWVNWSYGGDYLGWCPMGYRDRPVYIHERGRVRGQAVPRGTTRADNGAFKSAPGTEGDRGGSAWMYVKRDQLGSPRGVARSARFDAPPSVEMQVIDTTRARLTKDLSVADGAWSAARGTRTKPAASEGTDMHAPDPGSATIPFTAARRHGREDGRDTHSFGEAATERTKRSGDDPPAVKTWRGDDSAPRATQPRDDEGTAVWSPRRRDDNESGRRRDDPPAVKHQDEREVLRPLFGGVSRPRHDDGGSRSEPSHGAERERPRANQPEKHSAPPPPPPPPPPQQEKPRARERHEDKEHH